MEVTCTTITWDNFKKEFLDKYFPKYVCNHKEVEFLKLKLSNITVADYATKFEKLARYCYHCNGVYHEGSKCVKFEGSLSPEIK